MILPIDFIFDLHLVGAYGPPFRDEPYDEFGGPNHDVYFTFSTNPNSFSIDAAWFRSSGDIVPGPVNRRWGHER